MRIMTKAFGEAEIDDSKKLHFENGIIGFPDIKDYVLLFDSEGEDEGKRASVMWLQSTEEPMLALPVMDPLLVSDCYQPFFDAAVLSSLGETREDLMVLCALTVPSKIENMTMNQKAPILINPATNKACQIILENPELQIKYPVYEILKRRQEKASA